MIKCAMKEKSPGRHQSSHWLEIEAMAGANYREVERHAPRERLDQFDIESAAPQ